MLVGKEGVIMLARAAGTTACPLPIRQGERDWGKPFV